MARNKHPEQTVARILDTAWALFLEKGYDNTSIQDIVDALGNLSKGAIYHHFKSKDDIIDALTDRLYAEADPFKALKNQNNMTGLEKVKIVLTMSLKSPNNHATYHIAPDLLKNPKMLMRQLESTMKVAAPQIQLLIKEGVADGSIQTEYPKELAESLLILSNIWIAPALYTETREEFLKKIEFLGKMLAAMGLDLMDGGVKASVDVFANAVFTDEPSS